jgi:hypothetical protein
MSQASDAFADALIRAELALTAGSFVIPNITGSPPDMGFTPYLALCKVTVTKAMTGSTITEPVYGGGTPYARIALSKGIANWTEIAGGDAGDWRNAIEYDFAQPDAATSETVTDYAICTAVTAGEVLRFGTLSASIEITENAKPVVQVNALTLKVL